MSPQVSTSRVHQQRRLNPDPRGHRASDETNAFRSLLAEVKRDVDLRLEQLLDAKLALAQEHGSGIVELVSAVRDLCLRGGKRLRAGLVVVGLRTVDAKAPLEPALQAGVALELLQTYFLIHDDWMDGDTVRRGGPAVHTLLGQRLRSRSLGEKSGILAGDYAVALAAEALAAAAINPARRQKVFDCFARMQVDAVMGQQLDVLGKTQDVEAVYALKTSSYTVRGPLVLGALLGGGGARTIAALERFSHPVGVAFQLQDDLIGAYGEPAVTGKPLGSDLKSAKRTALLTIALKRARGQDRQRLKAVVGNARASAGQVRQAIAVLDRCGARQAVEERIAQLVAEAQETVKAGRFSPEGSALLDSAATTLTARRH